MSVFDSVVGNTRIELICADIGYLLHAINEMMIPIYDLYTDGELTARLTIPHSSLKQVITLSDRRGGQVKVLYHSGIFQSFLNLQNRLILLLGITVMITLTLLLPTRVLFVEVQGNQKVAVSAIMEAAQKAGVGFFASRRSVRSEKMKNELLDALPQLQWAGINTNGCTAVISVRERSHKEQMERNYGISRIVAGCDGVVISSTVTGGTCVCNIGQAVQKGQLLVSGYTDCGGVIIAGRASGEIFAQTRHEMTVVTPLQNRIRAHNEGLRTNYCLLIGKKRINFYKGSGIPDGSCVKMVTQYDLTLPGGFVLPLTLVKEQYTEYGHRSNQLDAQTLYSKLSEFSRRMLGSQSVALTITDVNEEHSTSDCLGILNGVYSCTEMIGREEVEEIGAFYGKTD